MDYELYSRIIKGNRTVLRKLQESELPWAYFVCYRITQNTETAAALLRQAWKETLSGLVSLGGCPKASFRAFFANKLYWLSERSIDTDDMFANLEIPRISEKFDFFIYEIDQMKAKEKKVYLLNKLGNLDNNGFSEILGIPLSEAKEYLHSLDTKAHPRETRQAYIELIGLSNEFKGTNTQLFEAISLPPLFIRALEHDYHSIFQTVSKKTIGKDSPNMKTGTKTQPTGKTTQPNRRAAAKKKKIIISAIAALLVIAIIITFVVVANKANRFGSAISTLYTVNEITYGNVSTTISGSGSLTPITNETLTAVELLAELEDEDDETTADTTDVSSEEQTLDTTDSNSETSETPADTTNSSAENQTPDTEENAVSLAAELTEMPSIPPKAAHFP